MGKSPIEVSFALDALSVSEKEIQKQIAFVKDMKESFNTSLNNVKEYHLVVYGELLEQFHMIKALEVFMITFVN